MRLPEELRRAIEREVAAVDARLLPRAAREISQRYQKGEALALRSPAHLAAYLATRLPATFAANHRVFEEVAARMPGLAPRSLLDLGAGPGIAAWAAAETWPSIEHVTLVEAETAMAAAGRALAAHGDAALRDACWLEQDALTAGTETAELVVASYLLGELEARQLDAAVEHAWTLAADTLVIVE
ncbi:MAG TPA: small ribosomal subunit Rsm22 family protein, partial [Terriglobales bacterium]|nr:small ribosomal subunit Rsm22 family protein [Terriglobales bacterium]